MLPRMSYLPLATGDVRERFSESAAAKQDAMWFELALGPGVPLKWFVSPPRAAGSRAIL